MMPQLPDDWVAEETLATELNVPRELLRSLRPTLDTADTKQFGAFIGWKKTAATGVANSLGLVWPAPEVTEAPAEKNAPEGEQLTVVSVRRGDGYHFPNRRLIQARRASGEVVNVLVIDSSKYMPRTRDGKPMSFRAKPSSHGAHWALIGREPRYPGQW